MRSDESRLEQPARPAEPALEAQRNLPHLLEQLAQQAGTESVKVAAKYATLKTLEKVFGDQDKGGGTPEPPSEQPPPQAE